MGYSDKAAKVRYINGAFCWIEATHKRISIMIESAPVIVFEEFR